MTKRLFQLSVPYSGHASIPVFYRVQGSDDATSWDQERQEEYLELLSLVALGARSPIGRFLRDRIVMSSFTLPADGQSGLGLAAAVVFIGTKRDLKKLVSFAYAKSLSPKATMKRVLSAIVPTKNLPDLSGMFSPIVAAGVRSWFKNRTKDEKNDRAREFSKRVADVAPETLPLITGEIASALAEVGNEEPFSGKDIASFRESIIFGPLIDAWLSERQ